MKNLFLAIILSVITICSNAEIESGAYIIGSVGYGYVSNDTGYNVTNNTSYTLGLEGGYSFNKYFALDGGITFMPNSYQNQTTNYYLTDIAVRGSLPLSNFVSAYLHVGPGMLFSSSNNNQLGLFVGIGALFQISHHFGINVEDYGIYIPGTPSNNINILALGVGYAF